MFALHLLKDLSSECAGTRADPEQHAWLDIPNHVRKRGLHVPVWVWIRVRVWDLVHCEVLRGCAGVRDQALAVHEKDPLASVLQTLPRLLGDCRGDEIRNAHACLASTEEEERLVFQLHARNPLGSQKASKYDGSCSLNVVVEAGALWGVLLQETESIRIAEVLELQQNLWAILVSRRGDELIDELVICFRAISRLAQAHVGRVFQQRFVVCPNVNVNRQAVAWVDACARSVEGKLSNGNAHAIDAKISEPENALAIREHNRGYFLVRPVLQDCADVPLVAKAEVHAPRSVAVDVAPPLTGLSNRGSVHERHELMHVLHEKRVVQVGMRALQTRKEQVLVQRLAQVSQAPERSVHLHIQVQHARRQQSLKLQVFPLGGAEGQALVCGR
mmetsp:Transcript_3573/g.14070  ORF Transcript_3573/g.14070 Transcript_3573/m.14070 type:complete len:388 (-) Transcript_3573:206-1369(-)